MRIQKIDGKMAQQANTHRGNHKWIFSPWWKMIGGRSEIRLDAFDIKKSMISFETRRDDSRIYLAPIRSSSRYAVRSYFVLLIIECAIIVGVCAASRAVSYRSLISADCKIHSCYSSCETLPYRSNITKHATLPSPFVELVINVPRDVN